MKEGICDDINIKDKKVSQKTLFHFVNLPNI